MATTPPIRIPEEVMAHVQQIAGLRGEQADLLVYAWEEFLKSHRDKIAQSFDEVAALVRAGDTRGLMERSKASRKVRAAEMASAANPV